MSMPSSILKRSAVLGLLLAGAACARNNSDDTDVGAARDSSSVVGDSALRTQAADSSIRSQTPDSSIRGQTVDSGMRSQTGDSTLQNQAADSGIRSQSTDSGIRSQSADSASNQTESGVTDSSGRSTLGPGATQSRPDQGQPVTSKGDTVNPGVDSSTTAR